jgi:hypothetical protein
MAVVVVDTLEPVDPATVVTLSERRSCEGSR